jgi:predicted alpha/beta superfamily hydrolase
VRTLTLTSQVFKNKRDVHVYLPPGYDAPAARANRYPVLYLNDGFAVFSEKLWDAPRQVDQMIRAGQIVPLILVGIDSAATIEGSQNPARDRADEYLPYPDASEPDLAAPRGQLYPQFLFNEVAPMIEQTLRVEPSEVGLGGSSYGAIAALYASVKSQRRILMLMLESPPLFLSGERLTQEAAAARWPSRLYVGIGTRETDDPIVAAKGTLAINRFVELANKGGNVGVLLNQVRDATHNAAAWKARFPTAMRFLYGTPH